MSGIAAVIRFDGGPPLDDLQRLVSAAPHRAPDGVGTWQGPGAALAKLHRVVLPGQRTADQPFAERDGPHVAILDGRLDGPGDGADRVLAAVARHGAAGVEQIHGEFAFVVWNVQTRTVVAARDRLGLRPLHWAMDGARLLVASDVAQILAGLARTPAPDETAVSDLLAFEPGTDDRTLFATIRRVPPGHVLVVDDRGPRLTEYWRPEPAPADERRSDADYAEECRALLRRAVGERLRATTPPVLFFSGGIDSSSVLATALDVAPRLGVAAPQPMSMVFDQEESDERGYRRAFTERHGVAPIDVTPGAIDADEYLAQARRRGTVPDVPAEFIGRPLFWRAREIGARVGLTGAGGDFLFGGSTLQYADLLRRGRLVSAVRQYLHDRKTDDSGWTPEGLLTGGLWPLLPRAVRSMLRRPLGRVMGIERAPAWVRLPRPDRQAVPDPPRGVSHASWEICWGLRSGWTAYFLESGERGASESGVEPRHPLLDPEIVRFTLSLPERQRRRERTMKHVLRRAADLPPAIEGRLTKADFGYVILDAFEALGGRTFFERLQIGEAGWVDPNAAVTGYNLVRNRDSWRDQRAGVVLPRLWMLAAVELWYRATYGRSG
jgi:asparagine synthase (glutamine-hydrolysing)